MGLIDSLSSAGDTIGKYFSDRFGSVGKAYSSAWSEDVPAAWHKLWGGVFTMAMSPGSNRDSFAKGLGLWLDGTVGLGGGALKGTLGGAFELPALHETTWLLDKAYRYGVAYPFSWGPTTVASARLEADAARQRGDDPLSAYVSELWARQPFGEKGMWSSEVREVTPGQSMMWMLGGALGQLNPGNTNDPVSWLRSHDPRTPEGQAMYNGEESDFLLKYGSGSIDFFGAIAGDPTTGLAIGAKAARLKIKEVATADRLADNKFIESEVSDKHFQAVYKIARDSETPSIFKEKVAPKATMGSHAFAALWAAAKTSPEVFRDAYVVARGIDGLYMPRATTLKPRDYSRNASGKGDGVAEFDSNEAGNSGWTAGGVVGPDGKVKPVATNALGDRAPVAKPSLIGAQQRLIEQTPEVMTQFVREFAAWNIADDALAFGRDEAGSKALQSLAEFEKSTFLRTMTEDIPGTLALTERPRPRKLNDIRLGVHSWMDGETPIKVGRIPVIPAASTRVGRIARAFTPTGGYAQFLDAEDFSAMSAQHFRGNLIRSGMDPLEVEKWISKWVGTTLLEARTLVERSSREAAVKVLADKHGLDPHTIMTALTEMLGRESAVKQIMLTGEQYTSERAARAGAMAAAKALPNEAKWVRDDAGKVTRQDKRGEYGTSAFVIPDVDGVSTVMLQDLREMPGLAPRLDVPVTATQTIRRIPMIDYQKLDGQITWWKWMQGPGRLAEGAALGEVVKHTGLWTLAKAAKTKAAWDRLIVASDFAQMLWKSSALLRPSQTPRNLADEFLRRSMLVGKLPLIMSMMRGTKRAVQNAGPGKRGGLVHDVVAEAVTSRRASRTANLAMTIDDPINHAPHNNALSERVRETTRLNAGGEFEAAADLALKPYDKDMLTGWADGMLSFDTIFDAVANWSAHPQMHSRLGVVYDLYTQWTEGTLGFDAVSTAPRATNLNRIRAQNEDIKAENVEREKKGLRPKALIPEPAAVSEPSVLKPTGWYKDAQKQKIKAISKIGQTRLFKTLLLQFALGREGKILAFTADIPRRAAPTHAELLAEMEGRPATKAEAKARKAAKLETAEGLTEAEAQNSYLAKWIAQAWEAHRASKSRPGAGPFPAPGQVFFNPIDDHVEPGLNRNEFDVIPGYKSIRRPINDDGSVSRAAIVTLEKFIVDNLDDILRPDHIGNLEFDAVGNLRVGVARARATVTANMAIKASAAFRLKNFPIKEIIDAGHTRVDIKLHNGQTIALDPSLGGADDAEAFRNRISATGGNGTQFLLSGYSPMRQLDQEGGYNSTRPGQKGHEQSWERAVNAQFAGDPVMAQLLEGRPPSEVVHWALQDRQGTEWIQRMHFLGHNWVSHIETLKGTLDEVVPGEGQAGAELRRKVRERVATYADLEKVRPDPATQPEVHGASIRYNLGKGAVFEGLAHAVDTAQKILMDMPTDKASRFPFFDEAYRRHLGDLVRIADRHSSIQAKAADEWKATTSDRFKGKKGEPGADRAEQLDRFRTTLYDPDTGIIPMETFNRLQEQARHRAYHDVKYYLYDVTAMNDIARLTRFIVPFSSAIMDSYIKYGRIIRDTGGVAALKGLYYWDMFERNEMVQDENGYVLRKGPTGEDQFYKVDPETGETTRVPDEEVGEQRYVQFRLPSSLGHMAGKKYFGVDMQPVFAVNKKNFNVFIDLPASGPLVAIPANEFALSNPEFGESATIKRFVLPFGPSVDRGKVFLPSTVRTAWEQFQGEDGAKAEAQAKAIFQAELISFAREERTTPPTIQEARERASMMKGLRFAASWITPVSFQTVSPYQPFVDTYRQFVQEDPKAADEKFLARYGDEFYAVAMSTTRNNAGMTATLDAHKNFQKYKDLVAAYPDLAGLITGGEGGEFSKAVYETQKVTPIRPGSNKMIREVMSLDDSVHELEKRRVWAQYSKMQDLITAEMVDRGLTNLRSPKAKDLALLRDRFVEANQTWTDPASGRDVPSPWYEDYTTNNSATIQNRINAMWEIVQDPDLQKRDDIRGLVQYLSAREDMQGRMVKAKLKTLKSAKALKFANAWDRTSLGIRESNTMFAPLWARYLSNDDSLDL